MRPYLVVILYVRQQYMTELSLAEHNNVVKALPSDRTDQPFGISVLPWGAPSSQRFAKRININFHGSGLRAPQVKRKCPAFTRGFFERVRLFHHEDPGGSFTGFCQKSEKAIVQ